MSQDDHDMTIEELADGLALWEEHKPRGGEDWVQVAIRWRDAEADSQDVSHLFAGLLLTVDALREILTLAPLPHGHPNASLRLRRIESVARAALSPTGEPSDD